MAPSAHELNALRAQLANQQHSLKQKQKDLRAAMGIQSNARVVVCCDWAAQTFLSADKASGSGVSSGTSWQFLADFETSGVPKAVADLAREITNDASVTQLRANAILRNGILGEHQQMVDTGLAFEVQRARIMDHFMSTEPRHHKIRKRHERELKRHEAAGISGRDASRTAQIARRVAAGLKHDHHAVIDGFLPDEGAAAMGALLHAMHANDELKPGEVTAGLSTAARSDLMRWVPAAAEQPPALRAVVGALDELLLQLVREPDVAAELADLPLMRAEAQLTVYPGGGAKYVRHTDDARSRVRVLTCIVYAGNAGWREPAGGQLRLHLGEGDAAPSKLASLPAWAQPTRAAQPSWTRTRRRTEDVAPLDNRLVVFWSDARVPHEVLAAHAPRYAVSVWYHDQQTVPARAAAER